MFGRLVLWFVCVCIAAPSWAQGDQDAARAERGRAALETKLSALLSVGTITADDAESLREQYEAFISAPLNVNTCTLEELQSLPFMGEFLAYQLILLRTRKGGRLSSLAEIKLAEGWDDAAVTLFSPLLHLEADSTASKNVRRNRPLANGKSSADLVASYPMHSAVPVSYLGSPLYSTVRWQLQDRERYSIMLGAERDSFEPWAYASHRGFDSYAGHFAVRGVGILKQVVAGDYRLGWGEGLIIRQGFRPKSSLLRAPSSGTIIRPVTGTTEADKSRGVAAELAIGRWTVIGAVSHRYLDGRIDERTKTITGLNEVGLHRTEREWAMRSAVPMRMYAVRLGYESARLSISLGTVRYHWQGNTLRSATGAASIAELRNLTEHSNTSLSYRYTNRRGDAIWSGEIARAQNGAWATVQRLSLSTERFGQWYIGVRHIAHDYWAYYGQSATHYHRPNNEVGLNVAANLPSILQNLRLESEVDVYRSLTPRRLSEISRGYLVKLMGDYRLGAHRNILFNISARGDIHTGTKFRTNCRYIYSGSNWEYQFSISLANTTKGETERTNPVAYAFGARAGIRITPKLRLRGAITYFRADDWSNRIYLSEPRPTRLFSSTFLYGTGVRTNLMLDARLSRTMALTLQWINQQRELPHTSLQQVVLQLSIR